MGRLINETGHKFGRLTVIERSGSDKRNATWLCKCECGKEFVVAGAHLRSGNTRSCGCLWTESMSLPKGEASFNALFAGLRRNAKRRGHEWQLTKEQVHILTQQSCYYCGVEPNQGTYLSKRNGVYIYNGLDRVDNNQGYIINNVVPCCGTCNVAKKDKTTKQFKIWACDLYEHFVR